MAKFQKEMIFELEQAKKAQEFILPAKLSKPKHVKIASKIVPLVEFEVLE